MCERGKESIRYGHRNDTCHYKTHYEPSPYVLHHIYISILQSANDFFSQCKSMLISLRIGDLRILVGCSQLLVEDIHQHASQQCCYQCSYGTYDGKGQTHERVSCCYGVYSRLWCGDEK